jgi:hypothetical protein
MKIESTPNLLSKNELLDLAQHPDLSRELQLSETEQLALKGFRQFPEAAVKLNILEKQIESRLKWKRLLNYFFGILGVVIAILIGLLIFELRPKAKPELTFSPKFIASNGDYWANVNPVLKEEMPILVIKPKSRATNSIKTAKGVQSSANQLFRAEEILPDKITLRSLGLIPTYNTSEKIKFSPSLSNIPVFYVENLKLLDYEKLGPSQYSPYKLDGVEALFEQRYPISTQQYPEPNFKKKYRQEIEPAIKLMVTKNFSQSKVALALLLQSYPDDANINFYLGLSCFLIQDYIGSIPYFNKTADLFPPLFKEEALWYKALAYK